MSNITNQKASGIFGGGHYCLDTGLNSPQNNKQRVSI